MRTLSSTLLHFNVDCSLRGTTTTTKKKNPPPKQNTECDWSGFWKGLPPVDKNVHYSEHIVIKKGHRKIQWPSEMKTLVII